MPTLHKLLIVDDSPLFRTLYQKILSSSTIETFLANDPTEAIEILKNIQPACILSDFEMPNMNGLEFCKYIRSDTKYDYIPFIMLSTINNTEIIIECLEAGADDFIIKDTDKKIIEKKIKLIIEVSQARKNKLKEEKLNTYLSTVSTLKHEWNNALVIAYFLIDKFDLSINSHLTDTASKEQLIKFKKTLLRIQALIQSFQNLKEIEFQNYTNDSKTKMLKT